MTRELVEMSRTRSEPVRRYRVVHDYNANPRLCRTGVWVGSARDFTETVVLSFEHEPEDLAVGWSINGSTVIDPGYTPGTRPEGAPAPGAAGITYVCPVGDVYHQLSLRSTPGSALTCLTVQVLFRDQRPSAAVPNPPLLHGPTMQVCLTGTSILWPKSKTSQERACWRHLEDAFRRAEGIAHVDPHDPVSGWLHRIGRIDPVRLQALLETFAEIDLTAEEELAEGIKEDIAAMIRAAPDVHRPGPPEDDA